MPVGRRSLACSLGGFTEHELRTMLKRLRQAGMITQKRGRAGTTITARGREFLSHEGQWLLSSGHCPA
jgi:ribosomal protein S19E (S16A)